MEPLIDHVEITVKDMAIAVPFYDRLLPLLGYDLAHRTEAVIDRHEKRVVSYEHPRLGFAITSPLNAFAGEAVNRRMPGLFVKDLEGIKYEIVCTRDDEG